MIGIIDYGMGNLRSVKNALDYVGADNLFVTEKSDFDQCSKLLLPGVGAFAKGMEHLQEKGFIELIHQQVIETHKPILGICLGMQLLLQKSTEHGNTAGLGLVEGSVQCLGEQIKDLSLPHMGWNDIKINDKSRLLKNLSDSNLYFVHNYYCALKDPDVVTGTVDYGIEFDVVFESGNIFGCQFHPEKSHANGLQILKNFSEL